MPLGCDFRAYEVGYSYKPEDDRGFLRRLPLSDVSSLARVVTGGVCARGQRFFGVFRGLSLKSARVLGWGLLGGFLFVDHRRGWGPPRLTGIFMGTSILDGWE